MSAIRQFVVLFLLAGAFTGIGTGCYYDNVEDLYPDGCRTNNMSYTDDIVPILNGNCLSCHNSMDEQGGVNLETYDDVIIYVEDGSLLGSVKHEDGFEPMPLVGPMISNCSISKLEAWIDQGAINN